MKKNQPTLSISGNRDISKIDELNIKNEIETVLRNILKKYNRLKILTPLADGVDRLIARVVLERFEIADIKILVPIPMSIDIYKQTFGKGLEKNTITEKESIEEFDELCALIRKHNDDKNIFINLEFDENEYKSLDIDEQRQIRRNQYKELGFYLIDESDLLLAVYDKNREKKTGGTIEVVENFKKQKPDSKIIEILL